MREEGATHPFDGRLEQWSYEPVVAAIIRRALGIEKSTVD